MPRSAYHQIDPYRTKDGSEIRELMHPSRQGNANRVWRRRSSRREAPPCSNRHLSSEEIYHFTAGEGEMRLGDERFDVRAGDTVCIPPGVPHSLRNPGTAPLRLLCCCAPPYRHDDTEILE